MPLATEDRNVGRTHTAPEDKVPLVSKVAYGLGTCNDMWGHWLYPNMAYQVFNIYLGVAPQLVGTALALNRLFDAVSDPFFGWKSDNARTRFGRRRPFILIGSIFAGVGLPFMFFVSPSWSEHTIFAYMLLSAMVYVPMMSLFNMPFQSLGNELTPDYHERTTLMAFKGGLQKVAEVAMFFALQFTSLHWFFDAKTGKSNTLLGARVYCAILGVLMILVGVAIFTFVKERYYQNVVARNQARVSIKESIYQTLACRPFRLQLGMTLGYAMGTSVIGALGYYATAYYVCRGNTDLANSWNFAMGIANMVGGLLGALLFGIVAHHFGKVRALLIAFVCGIGAFAGTWWTYNPAWPALQLLASGSIALSQGAFWMLLGSIGADVMDYDELETGKRREGAFSACNSWIIKFGLSLGALAAGEVLGVTGFDAKLAAQSEHTIFMIRFMLAAIPIVGCAISIFFLFKFPLTQRTVSEVRAALEQRRGRV